MKPPVSTLFVAEWAHTWGEYHGILGVFDSREKAEAALRELSPDWEKHGLCEIYEVGPLNVVSAEARAAYG